MPNKKQVAPTPTGEMDIAPGMIEETLDQWLPVGIEAVPRKLGNLAQALEIDLVRK